MTPIHYFWIGNELSQMELLALKSASKQGHQPTIWTYDSISNLPSSVVVRRGEDVLPKQKIDYLIHQLQLPLAVVSDLFRYQLLHQVGGLYSDTDVVILRNLDPILDREFFCSTYEYGYGQCASNCFMHITAGSTISKYLVEESERRLEEVEKNGLSAENYCYLGPFLVQQCAAELGVAQLPYDFINPISWRWVSKLIAFEKPDHRFLLKTAVRKFLPSIESRGYGLTKDSFAIHLCNEIWKQQGLNKNSRFHRQSLYERLKRDYSS